MCISLFLQPRIGRGGLAFNALRTSSKRSQHSSYTNCEVERRYKKIKYEICFFKRDILRKFLGFSEKNIYFLKKRGLCFKGNDFYIEFKHIIDLILKGNYFNPPLVAFNVLSTSYHLKMPRSSAPSLYITKNKSFEKTKK